MEVPGTSRESVQSGVFQTQSGDSADPQGNETAAKSQDTSCCKLGEYLGGALKRSNINMAHLQNQTVRNKTRLVWPVHSELALEPATYVEKVLCIQSRVTYLLKSGLCVFRSDSQNHFRVVRAFKIARFFLNRGI